MNKLLDPLQMIGEFLLSQECRIWLRLAVKPLAVIGAVALLLWLGAWCDAHIAQAEASATEGTTAIESSYACPKGFDVHDGLCYAQCPPYEQPVYYQYDAPQYRHFCVHTCPSGFTLIDNVIPPYCYRGPITVLKAAGYQQSGVPLTCATNQEQQGGLCYPKCITTHYGAGPICWQRCPAGYTDDGAFCRRPFPLHIFAKNSYGRGGGGPLNACAAGLQRYLALCYPPCKAGYSADGAICARNCPPDYTDLGTHCRKAAESKAAVATEDGRPPVPLNFIPEASDETINTPKNTPVQLAFAFVDVDADPAVQTHVVIVKPPDHGKLANHTYTPDPDFAGTDTIQWRADDYKHASPVAIAAIVVGDVAPNQAPVALDRTVTVSEDTPITLTITCSDADNDALVYQLVDLPQHGAYAWLPPNTAVYTPTLNFVGTDSFTFRSHDGQASSNISTITFTVGAVNDAPLAADQTFTTTRNSNAAITLFASDVESDTISYTLVSSPTHGSLSGEIPNLLYTPNANFVGDDSFGFRAGDVHDATTVAMISITVQPTNTAPVADKLVFTTTQESAVAINLSATDDDSDDLTYRVVSSPTHGSLIGTGADWVYTPAANFIGAETFTFTANDGQVDAPNATVTINVGAAPDEASVAGLVFEDRNGNGQPDGDEVGVAGLLVTLTPVNGRAANVFSTTTEAGGGWRIDNVPFGQYSVQVVGGNGVQIEKPVVANLTVGQRGLQQVQSAAVNVTGRAVFLPMVLR